MKKNSNPLFDSQREKAGSQTISKYLFQYNWALYKIIKDHDKINEYAIFIELHEDVVISDSLESEKAKFSFNQIKATKTPFNTNQLVKNKKNGSSVLGKLIKSGMSKPFSASIETINLVSVNDFSLGLKKDGVVLKTIRTEDLSDNQISELEKELKKEIGLDSLPKSLQFIVTDLPESNYQLVVIGAIASLINSLFPGSYTNSEDIYKLLIDELLRKGKESYDFTQWDELLHNKALTSVQVTKVLNMFTNIKNETLIDNEFNSICAEIGLKSIEIKKMKRSFLRYKTQRISNRSTFQIDTTKEILKLINSFIDNGSVNLNELFLTVKNGLSEKILRQFTSEDELKTAIICEYIMMS